MKIGLIDVDGHNFYPFNPHRKYYYIGADGGLISTDLGKEDD